MKISKDRVAINLAAIAYGSLYFALGWAAAACVGVVNTAVNIALTASCIASVQVWLNRRTTFSIEDN